MGRINIEEAAELLGVSADHIKLSRQRGLEPGRLGIAVNGEVWFEENDLEGVAPKKKTKKKPRRDKVISDGPAINLGGGWFELPDGSKVQGRKAAGLE